MERRRRVEYRHQQVVTDVRVELHASVDEVAQTDASLDDDERTGLFRGKRCYGQHDLVVHAATKLPALTLEYREPEAARKIDQCLPYLALEKNDDRDPDKSHRVSEDKL